MIRPLQITDIAGLLSFLGKTPTNEARTLRGLVGADRRATPLASLLMGCLLPTGATRNMVYSRRGEIQGLACLRRLSGPAAWEVEQLLLLPGHEDYCADLLERLGVAGNEVGIERLFLRLESGSPTTEIARQAGFGHYLNEFLYVSEQPRQPATPDMARPFRPRSSADEQPLFRLYSAAVPVEVRSAVGMTYSEWSHSRSRYGDREFVAEDDGNISSWLSVKHDGKAGHFSVLSSSGAPELREMVERCLSLLRGRSPLYCLVPEYQVELRRAVEDEGFEPVAEYSCFSKQLTVRVREARWVPLQA